MKMRSLLFLLCFSLTGFAQQPATYTWSSTACPKCQSTIVYQAWYPDGSPLVAEGMAGTSTGVLVALSLAKDTLVLSLGLRTSQNPPLTVELRKAVTIETESAPDMVLYPMLEPGAGVRKDDVAFLRSLSIRPMTLLPQVTTSGFLYFPMDQKSSHFVVVVRVGGETFRFPFAQDPVMREKFSDPAKIGKTAPAPSTVLTQTRPEGCLTNVSLALLEEGRMPAAQVPDFASKWLEKNRAYYPGLCFSQTPAPHIANYLVLFARSEAEFDGLSPSVRTLINATATVAGGLTWSYADGGIRSDTITTTTWVSSPYANRTRTTYAVAYDQNGRVVSRRQRTVTTGDGRGPASNLAVNLTASVKAAHLRERVLEDAMRDLVR